ncbi:hypothetical protein OIO90_003735 [Microbotryomycetes sp. JL221]|nr:hypothetical protein OIO90_003735 [Microbotryomycetes sp. JL221]
MALLALCTTSCGARITLKILSSSSRRDTYTIQGDKSSLFLKTLERVAETVPQSQRQAWIALRTRNTFVMGITVTLAIICESIAARIVEAPAWSLTRLAIVPLVAVIATHSIRERSKGQGTAASSTSVFVWLLWAVLVAGPATTGALEMTSAKGWLVSAGYAIAVTSWITLATSVERDKSQQDSRLLFIHLVTVMSMLLVPLMISGEIRSAQRSNHFGFFTEIGFWLQEAGITFCGLATLAAFYNMVQSTPPVISALTACFKDFLLPQAFALTLGNPLTSSSEAVLSLQMQWVLLLAISAVTVKQRSTTVRLRAKAR